MCIVSYKINIGYLSEIFKIPKIKYSYQLSLGNVDEINVIYLFLITKTIILYNL